MRRCCSFKKEKSFSYQETNIYGTSTEHKKHGRRGISVMGCVDVATFSDHFCYFCLPPTCVRFLAFLSAELFYKKCKGLLLDQEWTG